MCVSRIIRSIFFVYRGPRLLWTPLNPDIVVFGTRHAEPVWCTRYTQPRLMQTAPCIPDKSALMNVFVLNGDVCTMYSEVTFSQLNNALFRISQRLMARCCCFTNCFFVDSWHLYIISLEALTSSNKVLLASYSINADLSPFSLHSLASCYWQLEWKSTEQLSGYKRFSFFRNRRECCSSCATHDRLRLT